MSVNMKNHIRAATIVAFFFLLGLTVSGCGLPKEADFSEVEGIVTRERDEIDRVFAAFDRLEISRSIYYCRNKRNNSP